MNETSINDLTNIGDLSSPIGFTTLTHMDADSNICVSYRHVIPGDSIIQTQNYGEVCLNDIVDDMKPKLMSHVAREQIADMVKTEFVSTHIDDSIVIEGMDAEDFSSFKTGLMVGLRIAKQIMKTDSLQKAAYEKGLHDAELE